VIIKKFADLPSGMAATGEAEIQIYVSSTQNYIEVEQQGAFKAVDMGMSETWTVTWFVRKLPSGVTATVGSQALVDFVNSVVQ
jgi:hypothetical protein